MPKKIYHIKSFDGGINKKADPRDISDKELVEVTNASVSNIGRITMPGDGKSAFATVNEEDVLVSPTANQELGTMINNTPISPGYGLFSFTHDYNFDNTTSNTEPEQINTEYMCINDGAHIDVWTDTKTTAHNHWKQSLIKLGHVHDTGYDGTSENLINLNTVKSIYYKADNGVRICDANFGEEQIQALTNGAITSDATTQFNVDSGHGLQKNEYIKIDSEIMKVTTSGSTQITVERGRFGTKIANHDDDSSITRLNVPKILCHIKRPMLDKAGANVTINRWIQDVQMPEPPKYDALTVFDANIIGYDGTNLTTQGNYPSEPEKVHLGISLNTVETNAKLIFKDGASVTSDTTSTETVVTITLAAETDDTTAVDVTSSTYNFAVGKFISIDGATGEGTALNGVFEIVGFGDDTGEVKIAADTDVVGYEQTGDEVVILEDEIIDDNLKNKYIFGMSYMYDGGGSALQESDITTALFNAGPNLIAPDNTFRTKGTAIPMFRTILGIGDNMADISDNLIDHDTVDNSTFTNDEGQWIAYGTGAGVSHSSGKLQVTTTTSTVQQGCQLPEQSIGDGSTSVLGTRHAYKITADIQITANATTETVYFELGGTSATPSDGTSDSTKNQITTASKTMTASVVTANATGHLKIYTTSSTNTTFTVDNVKVERTVSNLDEDNTHDFDFISPGHVQSTSGRNNHDNWIYYETQPETPIEVSTDYHVSGAFTVTSANSGTEQVKIYVGIGPGSPDVSVGSPVAVTLTIASGFSGLVEFSGIATSASSCDPSVPVAMQLINFSSGSGEQIVLHSINVTKVDLQPMSQSNAIDLRSVKNISKSYIAFLCNNSKSGGPFEDNTIPANTWNERIEGFRIYMKQVDIIGGGLADEWTMLYDVDLKDGTYVMHAKDSDEETLRLGDISSNIWDATSTNDNHALVTGNVTGDSIKVPPTLTYESQTGYKAGTNLFARYKASAIVDRKVYIGNLKIGDKTFPDRMIKADTDKFDSFPDDGTHFIDVATSDGESIIALESSGDKLIQFKEKTAYAIRVTSAGEELVDTWSGAGVKHSCQIAKTSDGVFWVNAQGIYYYNGEQLSNVSKDKFNIDNWLTNEDFKNPVIVGYDKYSNKIIILTPNISNAQSSGYIYDINNQAVTQHNNLFNWYALFNTSDEVFGNTESEL